MAQAKRTHSTMNHIIQLEAGAACARLVPAAGGRISSLQLAQPGGGAVDVLHPYPEDFFDPVRWGKGGIYPLMPYSNRIANARLQVQGEEVRLSPHPDALPHTLHGNAHLLPWTLQRHDAATAVMVLDAAASPAWPWHYTGRLEVALVEAELQLRITVRNASMRVMARFTFASRIATRSPKHSEEIAAAVERPIPGKVARCASSCLYSEDCSLTLELRIRIIFIVHY